MIPLLAIAAWSDMRETTLPEKLILKPRTRSARPGLIKHTHHNMDVDKLGKDSYEPHEAGAAQMLVASQQRWVLTVEAPGEPEPDLVYLANRMDAAVLNLVLVEGFKCEPAAKIVLFCGGYGHSPEKLTTDKHVIAVASGVPLTMDVPLLDINDIQQLADFVTQWIRWQSWRYDMPDALRLSGLQNTFSPAPVGRTRRHATSDGFHPV